MLLFSYVIKAAEQLVSMCYLKDSEQTLGKGIEAGSRLFEAPARSPPHGQLASKQLGAQEGEDAQEQEEEDQKRHDRLDRVDQ